jgi:hypothetical protein
MRIWRRRDYPDPLHASAARTKRRLGSLNSNGRTSRPQRYITASSSRLDRPPHSGVPVPGAFLLEGAPENGAVRGRRVEVGVPGVQVRGRDLRPWCG